MNKIKYWNRIFKAYVLGRTSHLSFWHEEPKINSGFVKNKLGPYYMVFKAKSEYNSYVDNKGIPMLNYQGEIGLQYNPIAIAQWGLGNYNRWYDSKSSTHYIEFIKSADWLVDNLVENENGLKVWMHYFNFEYRDTLKSPWYSGLAQGQGISVLTRAFKETKDKRYEFAAKSAFEAFLNPTSKGGVNYTDEEGYNWIEEYIVYPPTHILNGFIWALWGVYDYTLLFQDKKALQQYNIYKLTLTEKLNSFDNGFWSLYEHSGTFLKMISSTFYHKLHIVQLEIMYLLTGNNIFKEFSEKWEAYFQNPFYRKRALIQKVIFKVFYY